MTRRVLITCSRSWKDWRLAGGVLVRAYQRAPEAILVSGHCPRGDQDLERIWASLGGQLETYPADWAGPCRDTCEPGHRRRSWSGTSCPAAGDYRNHEMAALPGVVACLAFLGPCRNQGCAFMAPHASHGARDCADFAEREQGIPTLRWERF